MVSLHVCKCIVKIFGAQADFAIADWCFCFEDAAGNKILLTLLQVCEQLYLMILQLLFLLIHLNILTHLKDQVCVCVCMYVCLCVCICMCVWHVNFIHTLYTQCIQWGYVKFIEKYRFYYLKKN